VGKFTIARNYNDAMAALNSQQFGGVYLDHDLGDYSGPEGREMTGYDVLMAMVQAKMDGKPTPTWVSLLTANPVARQRMQGVIDRYFKG
jgi:CheY-like chemotaxis protein